MLSLTFALLTLTATPLDTAATPSTHDAEILQWRNTRQTNLKKPQGWLSLSGLYWLTDKPQKIGAGKGNDIRLGFGPKKLGSAQITGKQVSLHFDNVPTGAKIGDVAVGSLAADSKSTMNFVLNTDESGEPSVLAWPDVTITPIFRSGRIALRVKNAQAKTRTEFLGLDYFPITDKFRVEAAWEAYTPMKSIDIATVIGTVEPSPAPGRATFTIDNKSYSLEPILETGSDELFFIFADRTSGKKTYGLGRFLYASPAKDGKVILDFNKAYNPPCAFTAFATCPLPPPSNRLDIAIEAGELKYRRGHH
jgi:uncharacterized protein